MKKSFPRKAVVGALCLSLLSSGISIPASAASLGDVNQDGNVSIADIVALQKYLVKAGSLSSDAKANADMNSDGRVNVFDLSILKNLVSDPYADTILIHLSNSGISVENDYNNVVSVSGNIVTIASSGKYVVDGTINEGQLLVNVPDVTVDAAAVEITLSGVSITNSTMPCIYTQSADKVKITTAGENNLTDNASAARSDTPGCIYALTDLTITKNSTGTLNITSSLNRGIDCNEDLNLNGGTININTDVDDLSDADAVKARETVSVDGATVIIDSSADGLKSGKRNVEVLSGSVTIKAGNDAVQAATSIDISGGTVIAGGDRGLRLDDGGLLNITGGDVIATATDYQVTDAAASSASIDMSGSTQNIMLLDFASQQSKGQALTLKKSGSTVFEMTPNKKFSYALISSSNISTGSVYNLYLAGALQGYSNGTVTDFNAASASAEFTEIAAAGGSTSTDDNVITSIVYSSSGVSVLNASGASVSSPSNLTVSGSKVTITEPSVISVSGSSSAAQIVVDCDKTAYPEGVVELDLTGADLSNSSASPIYVKQIGDEVQIVAKSGTSNTISDGTSHSDTNSDGETLTAAIYAEDDLKIKGSGTLTVNGNTEDGIVTKNDLKLYNGTIVVNAVDDGIRGKDSVTIGNSSDTDFSTLSVTVKTSQGDGIKSSATDAATSSKSYGIITVNGGTVNITSYADGIQAEQDFVMNGGDLNIYTYQGSSFSGNASSGFDSTDISAKGIKAVGLYDTDGTTYLSGGNITINGGNITTDTSDDSLHCAGAMDIKGGVLNLKSGDDGMHSDNTLTIGTEGNSNVFDDVQIYISKCYEGVEGVYIYQCSGTVYVVSSDDGYNAAGGADGSGGGNTGSNWNQGWGGPGSMGGGMSSSYGEMYLKGGLVVCNSANGDHDAFDSNGNIVITGGYYCANGQDPMDCGDSGYSITNSGGNYITLTGGNTNLSTRYTFLDASGNAIVSFLSASGASATLTSGSVQSGGTVSGGTSVLNGVLDGNVIIGGTLSGGSAVSSGGSSSGGGPGSMGFF